MQIKGKKTEYEPKMNIQPFIQSEVSQKEKNKYHILMNIYGI